MSKLKSGYPTAKELKILSVLWEKGPSTVRTVHEVIAADDATGYTTTLKIMQIMAEKGLLIRDEKNRSHIYRAKDRQDKTQRMVLKRMMDTMFNGSVHKMVMRALSVKKVSDEELTAIRKLLKERE